MDKCAIVKDLLPLYADEVCSFESKKFVAEHLNECDECCKELESFTLDVNTTSADEKKAVKNFKKKTERKVAVKVISVILAVCIGVLGAYNVYWYAVFKAPFNKYEKTANEYFHEYKENNISPIAAVLGEDNSYGIDIDKMSIPMFFHQCNTLRLPSYKSVERARRRLQEHNPELWCNDDTQRARDELEMKYKSYAKEK